MIVRHSYDNRFIYHIEKLRKQYGDKMFDLTGIGNNDLDIALYTEKFFNNKNSTAAVSVDSNANVSDKSVLSWENESSKPIKRLNALYILWTKSLIKYGIKRANKLIEMEINGTLRIHDLHLFLKSYCWAGDVDVIVNKGMPFYDKIKINSVKHFDSYINLTLQYICFISNQIAGAVALPSFFIYADYFIRKDYGEEWFKDPKIVDHINQQFQSWIYSVNFSWRSNQSPFTNLSIMDKFWLEALFKDHVNPDFNKPNFDNIMVIQKMFVNEMVKNLKDNPFTFPVLTACLLTDKETGKCKDEEFLEFISDINSKTGIFNLYIDNVTSSLSSCCRLRSNIEEANNQYINSFGSGGINIGSHRVVTLNLPRIAYEAEDWEDFKNILRYNINACHDILDIHRELIQQLIDTKHSLPLYNFGCMFLDKQFSTIGFIGMNESLELMGIDIIKPEGSAKCKEILDIINDMNMKKSKADGKIRNVEQIPGESAAYTFAEKDKLMFSQSAKYDLYSNQYIPLSKNVNMIDRIIIQGKFDKECGGGSILHINLDQEVTKDQMKKLIQFAANKGVIYFAINYNLIQCSNCGKVFIGNPSWTKSPCHNADIKRFLRVVGFLTEINSWAPQRKNEYVKRQFYSTIES